MVLYVSQTLPDGSTVIGDADNPNVEVVLKPGQWDEIAGLPESEQRHRLREFLAHNRRDTSRDRSEVEQTMVDNASQGQGEAHQESERSE